MTEAERYLEEKLKRGTQGGQDAVMPLAATGPAAARAGWFTSEGRLNRMGYFLRGLCILPAVLAGFALCEAVPAVGLPLLIAAVGVNALQIVKRFHDLGQSGWLLLLLFLPFVNVCVGLWLLFGPGKNGVNRFGVQPI